MAFEGYMSSPTSVLCNSSVCERVNCAIITSEFKCKHITQAWAMRPDGAHVFEIATCNSIGDKLYRVCSKCHMERYNILGHSTKIENVRSGGQPTYDLRDATHVSRLVTHPKVIVTPLDEHHIMVNPCVGEIDSTGMPVTPARTKRITIIRERKPLTRRISVARALLPVLENGTMEISGADRKAIYDVIATERDATAKRTARHRAIVKAKLRV